MVLKDGKKYFVEGERRDLKNLLNQSSLAKMATQLNPKNNGDALGFRIIQTLGILSYHIRYYVLRRNPQTRALNKMASVREVLTCSKAIAHLSLLCIEDAHTLNKDILIAYLDLTQAFSLAEHTQLARSLRFLSRHSRIIYLRT